MATTGLHALVDRLGLLAPPAISTVNVQALIADTVIDDREIAGFVEARTDRYARHLVHRSTWFDVMVLTWMPGQMTPIHNHAGNLGWVRLMRGRIVEERYQLVPSTLSQGLDLAADLAAQKRGIELVATGRTVVTEPGAIASVDRQRAIHRLGNPKEHARDETAVTLHVYSKPHDACLAFDQDTRTVTRRELSFDNMIAL
jgi:predicted metal-dependent enzyme (double-stranded beta helix superfamily)